MKIKVNFKPDQYSSASPYPLIRSTVAAPECLSRVFGSKELFRIDDEEGRIGRAEIQIGDCRPRS